MYLFMKNHPEDLFANRNMEQNTLNTKGRKFLKYTAIASAVIFLSPEFSCVPKRSEKPNIVFILADQWRASATGYSGDTNIRTPNLERLAKESLNFRNAVSVCPVCTPFRASLMTGKYPTSTGMFLNDAHLPDNELCIAEVLSASGYNTAYIGKWHLDGHGRTAYIPPERRQGFEYWKAAECDHDYNHSHYYTGSSDEKRYWEGYDAFAQTKDAQNYIVAHAKGQKPFALVISWGPPHFPHESAPEVLKNLYPPEKIILAENVPDSSRASTLKEIIGYYAHCTALDSCVGNLLSTLDESGISNNTIFVFTSDHGDMMGSHGIMPKVKQVAWSESSSVPFLIRYPAVTGETGRVINTPINTPDIFPTILGLAKIDIPGSIEGNDLSQMIRDGAEIKNRTVLYMGVSPFVNSYPEELKEYRAIRTEKYTYVRDLDGPWLLFDDIKDPCQMDNLVSKTEDKDLLRDMDNELQVLLSKINDDFRPGSFYISEWGFKPASYGSVPIDLEEKMPQTPEKRKLDK
jgi:arylsulfatase A-like enzyme